MKTLVIRKNFESHCLDRELREVGRAVIDSELGSYPGKCPPISYKVKDRWSSVLGKQKVNKFQRSIFFSSVSKFFF